MSDSKMSDIIRASLDGIRDFAKNDTFMGEKIETASGVTVIPVSRISIGFATGGVDYTGKKITAMQNFGGGGGSGVSITPIAFLVVSKSGNVTLIPVQSNETGAVNKLVGLVEGAPDLISKIKNSLFTT